MNLLSSQGQPRVAAQRRHGGRVAIGGAGLLPISPAADSYTVMAGGTLTELPAWPAGMSARLRFEGVSTIAHSAKLCSPLGSNFITQADDVVIFHATGTGWLIELPARAIVAAALLPAGSEMPWPASAPPTGWLEEDGSALLISAYPALAAAIYCGNTDNGTAAWGYKATTNVSPGSNRSTAGTYIVLPDSRGEFLRGWDHGRGVDSSRSLWATQADDFKAHTHGMGLNTDLTDTTGARSRSVSSGSSFQTGSTGGTETRPRNTARMWIIKY